jgi:hypothetical protein
LVSACLPAFVVGLWEEKMTEDEVRAKQLQELVQIEVSDIVSAANEQGFAAKETLAAPRFSGERQRCGT